MILVYVAAAFTSPVESDSLRVSLMVIFRKPVETGSFRLIPRFRTVVVCAGKDMMKPQRHHIIHGCLSGSHHHVKNRFHEFWLGSECLHQPFTCNLFRRKICIPCHSSECIPRRLGEMMTTPVCVTSDVCYTSDRSCTVSFRICLT